MNSTEPVFICVTNLILSGSDLIRGQKRSGEYIQRESEGKGILVGSYASYEVETLERFGSDFPGFLHLSICFDKISVLFFNKLCKIILCFLFCPSIRYCAYETTCRIASNALQNTAFIKLLRFSNTASDSLNPSGS